jgi:hypothetical protein
VWEADEWKRFVVWACENGAWEQDEDQFVEWRENGDLHRENGPAFIRSNGREEWWLNGRLHRENGPAIVWSTGDKEWWLNGVWFVDETFTEATGGDDDFIFVW